MHYTLRQACKELLENILIFKIELDDRDGYISRCDEISSLLDGIQILENIRENRIIILSRDNISITRNRKYTLRHLNSDIELLTFLRDFCQIMNMREESLHNFLPLIIPKFLEEKIHQKISEAIDKSAINIRLIPKLREIIELRDIKSTHLELQKLAGNPLIEILEYSLTSFHRFCNSFHAKLQQRLRSQYKPELCLAPRGFSRDPSSRNGFIKGEPRNIYIRKNELTSKNLKTISTKIKKSPTMRFKKD